ncbi:formylglycine-generating enzyme family protein [Paludibacterium paludis]|uniref:Sulfatase-modifying factor enzyme-like domain-containing protein n=1 Tax=Paludibacterium paludis TaxID=1225769 RepID=A0A918P4W2_9NEIS|nr:formylglycine-generating enzyme family protein [Paludibacterium paludis]GGY19945.1 hypothetical protein GCM10011289_24280 [Paludibacterium paludis]
MNAAARAAALLLSLACAAGHAADYVGVGGGALDSALPVNGASIKVRPFLMRATPVSREEFRTFLRQDPAWSKERVPRLFAGAGYLRNLTDSAGDTPVTEVSWFAARAFCAAENARLPTWYEWEFAAAADATRIDARKDPVWLARILRWYERPAKDTPAPVAMDANVWGVRGLHGNIYEWVDDFNGLFVTADSRSQGEQKTLETCGAAALSLADRDNYAILMRIALLSALSATDTLGTLGFRCAKTREEAK